MENLEEDLLILQQLKFSLHKDNKRKLQSIVDALTSTVSIGNHAPSPKPSPPALSAATSNHLKAARRSVQQARRSTASGMNIRRSKFNRGRQNIEPPRGAVGSSSFRGTKNRGGILTSPRSRLEAIQRSNQEQGQQRQTPEVRPPPFSPDASPNSLSGNDSDNGNLRLPVSRSSSSPVRSRNRESGAAAGTSGNGGDGSNERIYCLCQRYSFGDMIACDNARCEIEWFHFACVDVKTQPKGRWYCPRCRGETSKVKRPDV